MISDPARWGLAFESLVGIACLGFGKNIAIFVLKIRQPFEKKHIQVTLTMAEIHMADHEGAQGLLFRPVKVHVIIIVVIIIIIIISVKIITIILIVIG